MIIFSVFPLFFSVATGGLQQFLNWSPGLWTLYLTPSPRKKKAKISKQQPEHPFKNRVCSCHYPTQNHSVTWSRSRAFIRTSAAWPSLFLQPPSCRITHLARPVNSVPLLGASLTLSSFLLTHRRDSLIHFSSDISDASTMEINSILYLPYHGAL